ncbi:aldo/keto reductase [Alterisphingorhabdus coralli]|uniref:Aldo/keto reductase n=1 Tax=Alterisphingorhabdus coralli TaxID=3071408 RepID=A0AA97I1R4_9SPHN|nr:aldo/keto reductase [Parasphingorhabdus sp. SCSIO 66989]WOE75633.1 aldo/keto reductase [Parasphingorhabdus sp. SCSIO 66989]
MDYRTLGSTGLSVSVLSLGGLFVSAAGGPFERARDAVHHALARGVNYIDTAPMYLDSEEVLGRILADTSEPVILSTKLGARPQPFDPRDADALLESFETSCKLLGRSEIDILMIHEPDRPRQFDWWEAMDEARGPVMDVIDRLKDEGRIRFAGLGGTTAYDMARLIRTGRFDVVLTAFNTSLLWREAWHEILPAAAEHGVGVVAGSPLQQGALARIWRDEVETSEWLSRPRREQFRKLYALVDEIDIPLAELSLRFLLAEPRISTILMGARSVEEVDANVDAIAKGPLPSDLMEKLDEIAAMVPFRPHDEPFALPFGRPYAGTPAAGPV